MGEDASFLPPAMLEESELVVEANMNVEEWIVVQVAPDSADGQQIIGF